MPAPESHRQVSELHASLYNAMHEAGINSLIAFIQAFE
jgi:phosphoserine aminotransferase